MTKTSTKLNVTVAASLLGVALAATGAYAATGALTTRDAPGQVLPAGAPVTGVDSVLRLAMQHVVPGSSESMLGFIDGTTSAGSRGESAFRIDKDSALVARIVSEANPTHVELAMESRHDTGVWGAPTEDERRALKRRNTRAHRAR